MGCSYDVFRATLKQKEYKEDFVRLWNEVLKDELYDDWAVASMENFEENDTEGYNFGIDSEPLFRTMENGAQIHIFLTKFLQSHPDAHLTAEYECTFNNCGDMVVSYFTYENNILHIKTLYSENSYIDECPECECELENEISLYDWNEDKPMLCPECGCELKFDVFVNDEDIDITKDVE